MERRENSDCLGNSHGEHGWHDACDPFRAVRAEEDLISSEDGEHVPCTDLIKAEYSREQSLERHLNHGRASNLLFSFCRWYQSGNLNPDGGFDSDSRVVSN